MFEEYKNKIPAASPADRIGAALGGLDMLGARVSVYVPATCGTADAADNSREVDAIASTLSAWFGGATIQPGAGCWMSDTCGLVKEQTTVVYAACTAEQLADRIAALRTLCEDLKAEMQQEAVWIHPCPFPVQLFVRGPVRRVPIIVYCGVGFEV